MQIKQIRNTRHSIEENSLNSSYSDLFQILAPWWYWTWTWTHHLRLRSYMTSHHTWLIKNNYSMMYWSVLIIFKSFLFSSLTFNNCLGLLAWFHWLCNEQTIMECLQLIFFLPAAELSDGFTPRSFARACHFVLRRFCHCVDYKIIKTWLANFALPMNIEDKKSYLITLDCMFLRRSTTDLCCGWSNGTVMVERVANINSFEWWPECPSYVSLEMQCERHFHATELF